jgi:hypothetical protein
MDRRTFLEALAGITGCSTAFASASTKAPNADPVNSSSYPPARIENEYSLFLPGEPEQLAASIRVVLAPDGSLTATIEGASRQMAVGESLSGWTLKVLTSINGSATAVFEKSVTHQGAMVYVTESEGVILRIPKGIGQLPSIRPRALNATGIHLSRQAAYRPGPDAAANYILNSNEDPCYENMAGLGAEYIGYTLVANEEAGPLRSLFLEADGRSRQLNVDPNAQSTWAPDLVGAVFDPSHFFPGESPETFAYLPGYSKRSLLGGYLPVANIGIWNPNTRGGYEVLVALPPGPEAKPIARIRILTPSSLHDADHSVSEASSPTSGAGFVERYWNTDGPGFYTHLAGIANHWQHFFSDRMDVSIPDRWLLDAARAGIVLSRCSYRGLEPSYQIGEGAYTKIPERSHALFPVSFYELVWAHQLWNLTAEAEPYFQNYLDHYVLPDGNFLYNTQDQVEAPLCIGVFLWNSARAYAYTNDRSALLKRLPALRRTIDYLLDRYAYSRRMFSPGDRRYGLIWGSPEADLGDPENDYPNAHPYYFQNAAWAWRGLKEHAACLQRAGETGDPSLAAEGKHLSAVASEMRSLIQQSLSRTIAASDPAMRQAGIPPFSSDDIHNSPDHLSSYENHRFMMDWFLADWGDPALDLGHLKHRALAGEQIFGLGTDGHVPRISNFMEHGTLAVKIRQDDYRPFLVSLYGLCCYAADSGNRYSPEDAYIPGGRPQEGNPYQWSSVVNSVLQPSLGLRWLLCYEESDADICHLQKAAPKHWFASGRVIRVAHCPTRWGPISWTTTALKEGSWTVTYQVPERFAADLRIHVHPPAGEPLVHSSLGEVSKSALILSRDLLSTTPSGTAQLQ